MRTHPLWKETVESDAGMQAEVSPEESVDREENPVGQGLGRSPGSWAQEARSELPWWDQQVQEVTEHAENKPRLQEGANVLARQDGHVHGGGRCRRWLPRGKC